MPTDLKKTLLLGGPRHLQVVPIDPNYGTPITTGNGTPIVTHYHRTVFRFPIKGPVVDRFWYVYESDDYRASSQEMALSEVYQRLLDAKISPVNGAIKVVNLVQKRTIRDPQAI